MNRTSQIALGIIHVLIFVSICTAEMLDPRKLGVDRGEVISIEDNGITCFGPEHQFDAEVVLDFYKDLNIPISSRDFSNRLEVGEFAWFIYWGQKSDIESPIQSFDDHRQYYTDVRLALFTLDSWVAWYYILFQVIKWLSVATGLVLVMPWRLILPRAT